MNGNPLRPVFLLLGLFTLAAVPEIRAQGYLVDSQISGTAAGNGTYNYTLTLNNGASAANSIGTFWFAWTDSGYDLLPSSPTVTGLPAGWDASVQGGPYSYYGYTYEDGYSIEFTASLTPLAPGESLSFQFNSPDAPADIAGNSPIYGIPVGTSFVYSGAPYYDAGDEFLVSPAPVPEPSSAGLLAMGAAGLWLVARHKPTLASRETSLAISSRRPSREQR